MTSDELPPLLVTPIACAPWDVREAAARLWLAWTADGALSHALWTPAGAPAPPEISPGIAAGSVPEPIAGTLAAYFAGAAVDPTSLPVALAGTPFQRKVWNALRAIRRGGVRSYAGIAIDIAQPRAMRAVGLANSRNPVAVVVPCHRVVEKDLRLGGYTSGLALKRFLLALEGVQVVGDVVQPGQLTLI